MTTGTTTETAMIVNVSQILDGDALCHCGADAVLLIDSEPDNEPGPTCYKHGMEWINASVHLIQGLFGPKEA